jgi:hypothetical protein
MPLERNQTPSDTRSATTCMKGLRKPQFPVILDVNPFVFMQLSEVTSVVTFDNCFSFKQLKEGSALICHKEPRMWGNTRSLMTSPRSGNAQNHLPKVTCTTRRLERSRSAAFPAQVIQHSLKWSHLEAMK